MADLCDVPLRNASPDEIRSILAAAKTIAVVGLSPDAGRPSHRVASYLQSRGYRVIPVNPAVPEVLGGRSFARLQDVPGRVDIAVVFRKPEAVPAVVDDAIAAGAGAVWMQEGVVHNAAAERARAQGLLVVMDRCIQKEHQGAFG
jgi:predicted CoA-binding protein